MGKYDEAEARRRLADFTAAAKIGRDGAPAAAKTLFDELRALFEKSGMVCRVVNGVMYVSPRAGFTAVEVSIDEGSGRILFLKDTSVVGEIEGLQFNSMTGLLEGVEDDPTFDESGYRRPKRSALAVAVEAILAD